MRAAGYRLGPQCFGSRICGDDLYGYGPQCFGSKLCTSQNGLQLTSAVKCPTAALPLAASQPGSETQSSTSEYLFVTKLKGHNYFRAMNT